MTMTSNYDKYIRPETWPVPVENIKSVHFGMRCFDGMIEVRAWAARPGFTASRLYILDWVPEHLATQIVRAITEYVMACRKLTG